MLGGGDDDVAKVMSTWPDVSSPFQTTYGVDKSMTFKMSDYVSAPVGAFPGCFDTSKMKVLIQGGSSDRSEKIFDDFMSVSGGDLTVPVPNDSLDADPALRDTYFQGTAKISISIKFQW